MNNNDKLYNLYLDEPEIITELERKRKLTLLKLQSLSFLIGLLHSIPILLASKGFFSFLINFFFISSSVFVFIYGFKLFFIKNYCTNFKKQY